MEITREAIEQAVESYRQEMLDYWKELVNFQAGSKEGERMFALLSQVNAKLNREGFASELLPTGSPFRFCGRTWARSGRANLFCLAATWTQYFPTAAIRKIPLPSGTERPMAPGSMI